MTRATLPPVPEVPESNASELRALYREAAQAEPDAMLDRRILDAARAELRGAAGTKARRRPPWWKIWLPAASALALALVGLSVTWRVMDQQERDLRQDIEAADSARERSGAAAGSPAPAPGGADTQPLPRAPAPAAENSHRTEAGAVGDAPPGATGSAPMPATAAPAAMGPAVPVAPVVADQAVRKSGRAENEELRERRDAGTDSGPARQATKLEAAGPATGSSGAAAAESLAGPSAKPAAKSAVGSVSMPPPDAATPEAWLNRIRELRAAGRGAEAAQSLARFRARYPDFALPDDLLDLK